MDKRVIFAVAGSGKTTCIIDKLNLEKRFLLITYTENNIFNLRDRIVEKFGFFPSNIRLLSYFTFLHSFCFKPLLSYTVKSKGITWKQPPQYTMYFRRTDLKFYLDSKKRLFHNRIAKLCEMYNIFPEINSRLEKYFDCIFIDEIQDFAGHDFTLLENLAKVNCGILFVGDFFQHTFDTSNDGNVNNGLFSDYNSYKQKFKSMGLIVDTTSLNNSYRCSKSVCDFIKNNVGIDIYSVANKETDIITITKQSDADFIIEDNSIIKLFYSEHSKFGCLCLNWGSSKGIDHFNDVCVVLNKNTNRLFNNNQLHNLNAQTKNKFYVACTRTKGKLYFISDELLQKYKVKD